MALTWKTFLEVCEKARSGSAAKLERIKKMKEANYREDILDILEEESTSLILLGLFSWGNTEENPHYWIGLYDKLRSN